MKWYSVIMKRILKGIILFLLPLMLILFLLERAFVLVRNLIQPLKSFLPEESIFGIGMLSFLALFAILLICYFAGMRAEQKNLKSYLPFFENNILVFIPGYNLLKSSANEALGEINDGWKSVLIGENDEWRLGVEVDHQPNGYSTVFFPEPPDAKSGEMKLIQSKKLIRLNIPASKLVMIIRKYGHGASSLGYSTEENTLH